MRRPSIDNSCPDGDCAAPLQKQVGALTDSWRPNLATHLISSQLAGIAKHGNKMTQRLTQTCFQVGTTSTFYALLEIKLEAQNRIRIIQYDRLRSTSRFEISGQKYHQICDLTQTHHSLFEFIGYYMLWWRDSNY